MFEKCHAVRDKEECRVCVENIESISKERLKEILIQRWPLYLYTPLYVSTLGSGITRPGCNIDCNHSRFVVEDKIQQEKADA